MTRDISLLSTLHNVVLETCRSPENVGLEEEESSESGIMSTVFPGTTRRGKDLRNQIVVPDYT